MKRLHLFILTAIVGIMASGCNRDDDHGTVTPPKTGETSITLTLKVPGVTAPVSRALSDADENKIDVLDVLVFEIDGSNETFLYATHGSSAGTDQWRVPLQVGNGKPHRLVLLANLAAAVEDAFQANEFVKGRDKDEVLETIMFDASGIWDTDTPDYLPMWGESGEVLVTHNQVSDVDPIRMLRSVARVDIVMNPDISGAGQGFNYFTLDEVKVYNASEQGFAVPDPANVTGYLATDPTVDASIARTARSYPMDATQKKNGLVRNIYIAESDNNVSGMDYKDQTCLIISGYYRNDLVPTWYRIDFKSFTPPPENWDILRNHRYTVSVTSIDGRGYDKEEEALHSKAINIETEIEIWDEADMPISDTDGQYYLKVNTDSLYFYKEGRERLLSIHTDHPDGWSLEIESPDMDWVTASLMSANTGNKDETFIECTDYTPGNSVEDHREGYITIKAGRIRRNIKIYQVPAPELTIEVSPTELVFTMSGAKPKSITVTTYPANKPRSFMSAMMPGFAWASDGWPTDGFAQSIYQFRPEENKTGSPLTGTITVYITEGIENVAQATIKVMQSASDIEFIPTLYNNYPAAGGNNLRFTVSSASKWSVTNISDNILSLNDNSLQDEGTVDFFFNLLSNDKYQTRSVTLTIDNTNDDDFTPQTITLIQDYFRPAFTNVKNSIAFGTTTAAQNLTFDINSGWSFAMNANARLIATSDKAEGVVNPGGQADNPLSQFLTLTPVNYNTPVAGKTPAAGAMSGVITLTSQDHAPHTPQVSSGNISITRNIPAHFGAVTATPSTVNNIAWSGTTVTLKSSNNTQWGATLVNATGTENAATTYTANREFSATIGANNAWTTRSVTLQPYYWSATGVKTNSGNEIKYTQAAGYVITSPTGNLLTNSGASATFTVSLTGRWPNAIAVRAATGGTTAANRNAISGASGSIPNQTAANLTTTKISGTVTVGANTESTPRTVYIQYQHPVDGWTDITSFTQEIGPWDMGTFYMEKTLRNAKYYDAESTCAGLGNGWRLPTRAELQEIVKKGTRNYFTVPNNGSVQWSSEWSNSSYVYCLRPEQSGGIASFNYIYNLDYRCVRSK